MSETQEQKSLLPKLRFPEFRDMSGWGVHALGPLTEKIGSGITPTGGSTVYVPEGVPLVRSQNVGWGVLLIDDIAFISEETHATFAGTEIKKFDVLLNITGASIGRSALADERIAGGNVNQHVCIIRTDPERLSPKYLCQWLNSSMGQVQIESFQAGGNRQGLNFAQVRAFTLPAPGIDEDKRQFSIHCDSFVAMPDASSNEQEYKAQLEQRKIAECLQSLDELIGVETEKLEALKRHKKGLLQQLFPAEGETTPRLRFPQFRNARAWEITTLSNLIASIEAGVSVNAGDVPAGTGEFGVLKTSAVAGDHFNADENKAVALKEEIVRLRQPVVKDTIVLCRSNTPTLVGANAYIQNDFPNLFLPDTLWVVKCKRSVSTRFVAIILGSESGRAALSRVAKGTSSSMKKISMVDLRLVSVMLPSPPEQEKISSLITEIEHRVAIQVCRLKSLRTHKTALMQQLFPSLEELDAPTA